MNNGNYALQYSQRSLPYLTEYMSFATYTLKDECLSDTATYDKLKQLAQELHSISEFDENRKMAICAVDIRVWNEWCRKSGSTEPLSTGANYLEETDRLLDISPPYCRTKGHLYFHIKSDSDKGRKELLSKIKKSMLPLVEDPDVDPITMGNRERKSKVYNNRIRHGLISSVDPYNFSLRLLTGNEDPAHIGSCYCLTQKFKHNWDAISRMSDIQIEDMIGRDTKGNLVPDMYERSHLKCARVFDKNGINYSILTQAQPYGDMYREREAGVYVSAYGKSLEAFNAVMQSMIGNNKGFTLDEHLTVSIGQEGNMWYVPNAEELGLDPTPSDKITVPVDVFFRDKRSKNGIMHYNSKDFLHNLGRQPGAEKDKDDEDGTPLSRRLIELAGNTFSRWHNEWYRNKAYPRLGHLDDYCKPGDEKKSSIPERKGLTIKYMLGEILTDNSLTKDGSTEPGTENVSIGSSVKDLLEKLRKLVLKDCLLAKKVMKVFIKGVPTDSSFVREFLSEPDLAKAILEEFYEHYLSNPEVRDELMNEVKNELRKEADLFRIDSTEIIVGVIPNFTLGTGSRVVRYLTKKEHLNALFMALDENSMQGHVVPDYKTLVKKGIAQILRETVEALNSVKDDKEKDKSYFYQSVIDSLEGVQLYFRNYAALARKNCNELQPTQTFERENLTDISNRMCKLAEEPPGTFIEAAQLVFSMHCCLHSVGELVSIGRLDQVLMPFYKQDLEKGIITETGAQEIIDAFWLKMGEPALMNRQFFDDYRTYGTCAMPYRGGAKVPQGNKASQWVMQITVGGYLPNDNTKPEDGCNAVTKMCIKASRHMPTTAPCLSLRVNPDTPRDVLKEAALALLSGGASPFFFNDDMVSNSLANFGDGMEIPVEDARDYCADGCWEPIFFGKTEFSLIYTPVTNAVEAALNLGALYISAGPDYLRGENVSFQSPKPEDIDTFDEFLDIFYRHYKWLAAGAINAIVSNYGNLWKVCPSPLLSSLIDGCLESGRDLTNGGARYHIIAPMMLGMSCVIDSLWAIKKLVYEDITAVTTLSELRESLLCDWGHDMIEPLHVKTAGRERANIKSHRFKFIREKALNLDKFGSGNDEVDTFGGKIAEEISKIFMGILEKPAENVTPEFKKTLDNIKKKYKLPGRDFKFKLTPAFGTFEDYLGVSLGIGASADGRRKATTLASNFSPMPSPADLPPDSKPREITKALKGWNLESFKYAHNFATPVDIDITEDFPVEEIVNLLEAFGKGELGFNMLTISCANRDTLEKAIEFPEKYDLVRLRMGGWSEFFITMFPGHQEQHRRRPLFVIDENKE